jgi:hypothetical protein
LIHDYVLVYFIWGQLSLFHTHMKLFSFCFSLCGDGLNRFRSSSPTPPLSRSMEPPRSPPAKVGSIMWGSDTPLAQKGDIPRLAGATSKWVCSVCYFTENQDEAQSCEVCDSPNYNNNKVPIRGERCIAFTCYSVI